MIISMIINIINVNLLFIVMKLLLTFFIFILMIQISIAQM